MYFMLLTLLSFALWPVFLTTGMSGVLAILIILGLTDRFDARFIFAGGCCFSILGCVLFAMLRGFLTALLSWTLVGSGLAGTYMPR